MKNMRTVMLAAATATAVTLSGTAVAVADTGSTFSAGQSDTGTDTGTDTGKEPTKDTSSSAFGSWDANGDFDPDKALSSLKLVAAFGTAIASIVTVMLTLSTKFPQLLKQIGIDLPK